MAIFLNQEFGISYARFYGEYYAYLRGHKTLVGEAFIGVDQKMEEFFKDPDTHLVFDLGKGAALYEPEEYALHLTLGNLGRYFEELAQFLDGFLESKVKRDPRYQDLLGFQRQVIVTEDYDPRLGREFTCRYDWANYFCSDATPVKLLPVGYRLVANDTHRGFGLSQMKIKWHEMDTPGERFWNFFATVVCHRYYRYNTTNLTSFRRELAKEVSPEDLLAQ